jgi:hypothetical protein
MRPDFQDLLEVVVFDFGEKGFVADAQIFGGFALVATVGGEGGENFPALDEAEGAVGHFRECSREVELFQ